MEGMTEFIYQIIQPELLPAFGLLFGLLIGIVAIKTIIRISDFKTPGEKKIDPIERIPSWAIQEKRHHTRTLKYQHRIHHHRARVEKGTSRKL